MELMKKASLNAPDVIRNKPLFYLKETKHYHHDITKKPSGLFARLQLPCPNNKIWNMTTGIDQTHFPS